MAAYQPNGIVFDGSTNYLRRAAAFTNAVDSTKFTAAFSVIFTGAATDQHIISCDQTIHNGYPALLIGRRVTTNAIYMYGANTTTGNLSIIGSALSTGTWYNVLISIDQTDTAKRHLYVNDSSDLATINTYNNAARDFTNPDNVVGAVATGAFDLKLAGELSDLWFDIDRYVDFSVEANRRLFFDAAGGVVDKGLDGSVPFTAVPTLFLSGPLPAWGTNKGSGGGMTTVGTLTRSAVLPPASAGVDVMPPTAIEASTNLTGAVTAIDEEVDGVGADWLTATSAVAAIDLRVSFGTPS